jgi:hypothetical protein
VQQVKTIVLALVAIVVGGAACRQAKHTQQTRTIAKATISVSRPGWFIRSWHEGNIVVEFDGRVYEAKCDTVRSFRAATPAGPREYVSSSNTSPVCTLPTDLVRTMVQPHGGHSRGTDGWITEMGSDGRLLTLSRWKDADTVGLQEEFVITSVKPNS